MSMPIRPRSTTTWTWPAPNFDRFAELLTLSSIQIFGEPSEKAIERPKDKVRLLGAGEVTMHPPHAGFGRFGLR